MATLVREPGGVLVEIGSAGAKAMAVVQGLADIYVHAGGQHEWDLPLPPPSPGPPACTRPASMAAT